jgi:hypothetical protein
MKKVQGNGCGDIRSVEVSRNALKKDAGKPISPIKKMQENLLLSLKTYIKDINTVFA